uniref:Uncharacterized protein n=1 Tax=Cannabis sativa TaxID=3483 RepID=A0A803P6B9_CANSA
MVIGARRGFAKKWETKESKEGGAGEISTSCLGVSRDCKHGGEVRLDHRRPKMAHRSLDRGAAQKQEREGGKDRPRIQMLTMQRGLLFTLPSIGVGKTK